MQKARIAFLHFCRQTLIYQIGPWEVLAMHFQTEICPYIFQFFVIAHFYYQPAVLIDQDLGHLKLLRRPSQLFTAALIISLVIFFLNASWADNVP